MTMPNTETKAGLAIGCIFIAAFAVTLACMERKPKPILVDGAEFNVPNAQDRMANLLDAIRHVESGHDEGAWNRKEDARGGLQIRAIYVKDVNLILGRKKFTHNDAFIAERANEMFEIYCRHYSRKYVMQGMRWEEAFARCHNGGPLGAEKLSTISYWGKVESFLKD